ncbi:hypothetical protein M409DRAFT_59896 [Zasmidium cellare ATCC 36951]|uniref:N-acetyltransferase domain-containing protein n=1 Tax=Zasmidium cellare ATCC 36951 TaxID=1080233 RepID=A0A6A6C380_ZASCE|nr:uncharacterized protein M409DRAFT_59896 [Zasmidium cellare ATCC 36951]KAF2160650.1 hypothetical protein M409DRAFT_59896 [Zasmidium cellare ATCC 36951]
MSSPSPKRPMTFRLATVNDASHIANLINTAFRSEKTGQTWLYDEQEKRVDIVSEGLAEDLILGKSSETIMLAGTLDSRIAATCFLRRPDTTVPPPDHLQHVTPGSAWLGFLAVDPTLHSKGYGKDMLVEAERFVQQEWKATRLEFDFVHTRKELKEWYAKQGYKETGQKRPFFYGKDGRGILADGLEMVVLGKDLRDAK